MPDRATADKINKKIEVAIADENRIWRRLRKDLRLEKGGVRSFADLAARYMEQHVIPYNRDVRGKKSRLKALLSGLGKLPVDSIDIRLAAATVAKLKKGGVKNATLNRYIALLKHIMKWAEGQEIIDADPLRKLSKLKEPEWIGERPDESVIDRILGGMDSRALPVFAFMRETGCRRGEAVSLRRGQVDFAGARVTFTGTKSGRTRQSPLTDQALWAVQALPALPHNPEWVFYHPDTLRPWKADGLTRYWERSRGDSKLRVHDLRHAYAIRLAESGCAMHFISEVLGHHSIDFTRRRYARFSADSSSRAVLRVLNGHKTGTGV
jgi:integrase